MFLKKINLLNFKSYEEHDFEFCDRLNFIVGKNGSGKTNILESIYFSCLTKSFSGLNDHQLIKNEEQYFVVKSNIDQDILVASIKDGERKHFSVNKQTYDKTIDHLGKYPLVFVSPNDHDYIRDSSDRRRNLFDEVFCQVDKDYLKHLMQYNKLLKQRNQLLKQFKDRNYFDLDLLKTYNLQLCQHHLHVTRFRQKNLETISTLTLENYALLSDSNETVSLNYVSQETFTEETYHLAMQESLQKDKSAYRTSIGCHKDDFDFLINDLPLKKYGSQGQQKSFMLSLQLAKYTFLMAQKNKKPFLLLDDVFDKLDPERILRLLKIISQDTYGQSFITDASSERTKEFITHLQVKYCIIEIDN